MPTAAELAAEYKKGAADLRAAVKGMTREQLTARPIEGQWSTLEVICHLADFEPIYADRFKRIIALENPTLLAADENLFVKHLRYQERDADEELTVIEVTRNAMAKLMAKLTPAQLARTGTHSERGVLSLEKLIQSAVNHIPHHLPFIAAKRKALGI
jgi:uncharacterized damage-inducible protein DinB